jgi:hypothetical protein
MLDLRGDVRRRGSGEPPEPAGQRIADGRQGGREVVDLAGEHRHHEREQPADRAQAQQEPEGRSDRPRNVPALEQVGEGGQRSGDDHDDQHS